MKTSGIQQKLFGLLTLCIAMTFIVSAIGFRELNELNDSLHYVVDLSVKRVELAQDITIRIGQITRNERNAIISRDIEEIESYGVQNQKYKEEIYHLYESLMKISTEEGRKNLLDFRENFERYRLISENIVSLSKLNTDAIASRLSRGEGKSKYLRIIDQLEELRRGSSKNLGNKINIITQKINEFYILEKDIILNSDSKEKEKLIQTAVKIEESIQSSLDGLNSNSRVASDTINLIKASWQSFLTVNQEIRAKSFENSNQRAFDLSTGEGRVFREKMEQALNNIVELNKKSMQDDKIASYSRAHTASLTLVVSTLVGSILALILGFRIIATIVKTISRIAENLGSSAEQLAAASNQVSSASQSLSEGATEQAASIEETSSSLEEMSAMTHRNDQNAQSVSELMEKTLISINENKGSMDELAGAINEIKDSSDETFKIVKTIDEIAFQTNLLALNAAVEAARAGDAGRGFAVVADEVGALAQRASQAARSTSELLERSVMNAKKGVNTAQQTEKSLDVVIKSMKEVSTLMREVVASSQEQARGVTQINQAISQLNIVTQQNSSAAEESAASSEELNAQAEQLLTMVSELQSIIGQKALKNRQPVRSTMSPRNGVVSSKKPSQQMPGKVVRIVSDIHDPELEKLIPFEKNDEREVAGF